MSLEDEYKLFKYIKSKNDLSKYALLQNAVDRLIKFGVSTFKVGSGEMSNFPLDYISKFKKL